MDSAAQKVAEVLLAAIKAESDGYGFYMMAAHGTTDEQGREVFERLAREEHDHKQFLTAQYQSVLRTGRPDPSVKLGPRLDLSGDSPIFSPALKQRLKDAHHEMSALSIGIQLESGAMAYYREAAKRSVDPAIKAFFDELADWETGHYQALLRQQELLKDDFWSSGGFSPF